MTKAGKRWFVAAVAIVLAGGGYFAWQRLDSRDLPAGIASGNGRIEGVEIDVATKTAGRIKEILVNEGDFVTAGQVLARMDTAVLEAQLREAEAQLQRALIGVETARSLVTQREAEKAAAVAVVGQRDAERDAAQRRLARSEELASKGTAPIQQLDDDRAEFHRAKAAVSTAQAQVAAADAALSAAKSQIVDAQAMVEAAQASSSASRPTSTTAHCARRGTGGCSIASRSWARC